MLCGRQDANFTANSPCRCSKHIQTPSPPAYHVRTVTGEQSLEASSGCVNMCAFECREHSPPHPSPLLPAGSDTNVSPETVESSMVTIGPREDFLPSTIESLDDVPSLPNDTPYFSLEPSSSVDLPDVIIFFSSARIYAFFPLLYSSLITVKLFFTKNPFTNNFCINPFESWPSINQSNHSTCSNSFSIASQIVLKQLLPFTVIIPIDFLRSANTQLITVFGSNFSSNGILPFYNPFTVIHSSNFVTILTLIVVSYNLCLHNSITLVFPSLFFFEFSNSNITYNIYGS